jgi:hypothetical protein
MVRRGAGRTLICGGSLSAEEFHAGAGGGILIEGNSVLTFCCMATALNEAVGKVGAAGAEFPHCLRDDFRSLNKRFFASQ